MLDRLLTEWSVVQFLFTTVALAIPNAGLAMFVRALPWPKDWLDRKPLACAVCMNGWSAFATLMAARDEFLFDWSFTQVAFAWCALIALGAPIFVYVFPPPLAFPSES